MLNAVVIVAGLLVCVLLTGLIVCVAALGARMWADAAAATHRARAHGAEADATEVTVQVANDAVDEIHERTSRGDYRPTSDEDLLEQIVAERGEYTTAGNEGIEEQEPIPSGGFYRAPAGFD